MSTIVTRAGKGSPLTHVEMDANLTNLNADKYQAGDNATFGTLSATSLSGDGSGITNIDADPAGTALALAIALG